MSVVDPVGRSPTSRFMCSNSRLHQSARRKSTLPTAASFEPPRDRYHVARRERANSGETRMARARVYGAPSRLLRLLAVP